MVIFNFRADRVVELSKALEYRDFDKFDRKRWPDVSASITPHAAHNLNLARIRWRAVQTPTHTKLLVLTARHARPHQGGITACMLLLTGPWTERCA